MVGVFNLPITYVCLLHVVKILVCMYLNLGERPASVVMKNKVKQHVLGQVGFSIV